MYEMYAYVDMIAVALATVATVVCILIFDHHST